MRMGTRAAWVSYATTTAWVLDEGHTVYVRYRDNAGDVSAPVSDTLPRAGFMVWLPLACSQGASPTHWARFR